MNRREQFSASFPAEEMCSLRLGTAMAIMSFTVVLGSGSAIKDIDPALGETVVRPYEKTAGKTRQAMTHINAPALRIPLMVQPEGLADDNPVTHAPDNHELNASRVN